MFFRRNKQNRPESGSGVAASGFAAEVLRDLCKHFAIGERIRLRPEYREELELSSVVIGMMVNDLLIYDNEQVRWDDASQTLGFYARDGGKPLTRVAEFALLLPLESSGGHKMSYQNKEELSRVGLFKRGNTIVLGSDDGARRSYAIDGLVSGYLRLEQGLFANHEVTRLRLDPESFKVSERRRHQRLLTDVPATIRALKGDKVFDGLLVDFVEEAGRFLVDDPAATVLLTEGKPVRVGLELSGLDCSYQLEGSILKREGNHAVVSFRHIHKDGVLTPFSKLDGIEIKAMLNKLSQTRPG